MKGLDTNVLIRYLVQDDPQQTRKAVGSIEQTTHSGEKLLLNLVVMCETVWVLESAYERTKSEIVAALRKILSTKQFAFQEKEILWRSLDEYAALPVDFADTVIGALNVKHGCSTTFTFDRSLRRLRGMTVL